MGMAYIGFWDRDSGSCRWCFTKATTHSIPLSIIIITTTTTVNHKPIFVIIMVIIITTIPFSSPLHTLPSLYIPAMIIPPHTARTRVYKPPSSLAGFCFLSSHFHTGLYYTAVWCGVGWGLKSNILEFNVFGGVYGWGFGGVGGIKKRNKKDSWGGRGGERAGGGLKTRGTSADVWVGLVGFSPI